MSREISSISVLDYICKSVRLFHVAHIRKEQVSEVFALEEILRLASESEDNEFCFAELRSPGYIATVTSYLWEVSQTEGIEESLRKEIYDLIKRMRILRRRAKSYYIRPSGS